MGQRFLMLPWRNMICDDCKERGLPPSVYLFYSHLFGAGQDHICPPLTKQEIEKIVQAILNENRDGILKKAGF